MELSEAMIARMQELYDAGLYLQAFQILKTLPPVSAWTNANARVLAGRLISNLGGDRVSQTIHWRTYRKNPDSVEAAYHCAWGMQHRQGALRAWNFAEKIRRTHPEPCRALADLIGLQARLAGLYRDFELAENLLTEAKAMAPESSWLLLEKAFVYERSDRLEKALELARSAMEFPKSYRAAVRSTADLLLALNRDEEALQLLRNATRRIEHGSTCALLVNLLIERDQYREALDALGQVEKYNPLAEKSGLQWIHSRRSDAYYLLGEFGNAILDAKKVGTPFYDKFAERLADTQQPGARVRLDIGFVRQNYQTCAPATLAAISAYWGVHAHHLEVANEICYGGTPDYNERNWAVQQGFHTREFRVTQANAQLLLDRGIPFTLTTVQTTSAHLQAVIGYDTYCQTLLIRDPGQRIYQEFFAANFFDAMAPQGPRGMVFVPAESEHLLNDLDLEESALYDSHHAIRVALERHDRQEAQRHLRHLQETAPHHRITLNARRILAFYDVNTREILSAIEELLKQYPENDSLLLSKTYALRDLTMRKEQVNFLEAICDRPGADPIFLQQLAAELLGDARESERAHALLDKALRRCSFEAASISTLADLHWKERRFEEATRLYRFAACLSETSEGYSVAYFAASRRLKQTETALQFLKSRFARLGSKSGFPARTLYSAYSDLDRIDEAFAVLDQGARLRPEDGSLLLFAADARARYGNYEAAAELIKKAETCSQRTSWLRARAELDFYQCNFAEALRLWRLVLETEPAAADAHRAVTQLIANTEGIEQAIDYLRVTVDAFPYNMALQRLQIDWLRDHAHARLETAIRRVLEINPDDGWTRRELALCLTRKNEFEAALDEVRTSLRLEPNNPSSHTTSAVVYRALGDCEMARTALRQAIELSADTQFAIAQLIELSDSLSERIKALDFIRSELIRQVVYGDGLLAYRNAAFAIIEPGQLLQELQQALQIRPDLWHAWSAVTLQLCDMGRLDEALCHANQVVERFPLLPKVWFDLSLVHEARLDPAATVEALKQALQINPAWGTASRALFDAYERLNDFEKARESVQQAIARSPLESAHHGYLAFLLWKLGEKQRAMEIVEHALLLNPGYEWGWGRLREWSSELGDPDRAANFARALTETRGGEARSWLMLAKTLEGRNDSEESLAALEKAISLNPRSENLHDYKALRLSELGKYEEAKTACTPPGWEGTRPVMLHGREIWVLYSKGQKAQAFKEMKSLLDTNPDYYWGWRCYAEWAVELNENDIALASARHLVRLAPRDAISYGYLGDAYLRLENRELAKGEFSKAFSLDPNYSWAGFKLFDLRLKDNELTEAAATLNVLRKHADEWGVREGEVKLEVKRGDRANAVRILSSLTTAPADQTWALTNAVSTFTNAGWFRETEKTLETAIGEPNVNAAVGRCLIESRTGRNKMGMPRKLGKLTAAGKVGEEAAAAYLNALAKKRLIARLTCFMWLHRKWLCGSTRLWGECTFALTHCARYRSTIRWTRDWREREGVQPWMLQNIVSSLRHVGKDEEALEASHKAIDVGGNQNTGKHLLWIAIDQALGGQIEEAEAKSRSISTANFGDYHLILYRFLTAMIAVRRAPDRKEEFRHQKKILKAECRPKIGTNSPELHRYYRKTVKRMAKDANAWPGFDGMLYRSNSQEGLRFWHLWLLVILISSLSRSCQH